MSLSHYFSLSCYPAVSTSGASTFAVSSTTSTLGFAFADFDNDGDVDALFYGSGEGGIYLVENSGGSFDFSAKVELQVTDL